MKKILKSLFTYSIVGIGVLSLSSCLKDKGYENQDYGIQVKEVKGVRFGQAVAQPVTVVAVGIVAKSTPTMIAAPEVTLEQIGAAANDVTINVVSNPALVPAQYTALPAGLFNLSSSSFKILKGKLVSERLDIVIPNATLLNPTLTYGVGLELTSVDNNYTLASNGRKIVVAISIKNKYDGIWNLVGNHNRPGLDGRYNQTVELRTVDAFSANMFWPLANLYAHPLVTSTGSLTYYGSFTTNFKFNAADQIIGWDWTPYPTLLPTDMIAGLSSRYEPPSGSTPAKIFAHFRYNNNPARSFFDTLTRIGDRP